SSDKAVNPTNIMGASKCIGERLVRSYGRIGNLRCACVRFGNVMGSRGSVIPLFQRQIAAGGPITVTHPEIARFFMTIPEAVQLVVAAGSAANRGEVFVLDMGSSRKILDLAREMISLYGLEPEKDIDIVITGLRPGEKLEEELLAPGETPYPTRFEKLSRIVSARFDEDSFRREVNALIGAAQRHDHARVYGILCSMNLGFEPKADLAEFRIGNNTMLSTA